MGNSVVKIERVCCTYTPTLVSQQRNMRANKMVVMQAHPTDPLDDARQSGMKAQKKNSNSDRVSKRKKMGIFFFSLLNYPRGGVIGDRI